MPSSRQRALSRDIILSTALDLVDEEGQKPQDVAYEFLQENLPEYASK